MNKYYKNNVFIIGFGERVRSDIYPILREIVEDSKITIFSKSPRKENIEGTIINSFDIDELREKFNIHKPHILIVSIPPKSLMELFNSTLGGLNFENTKLFIDTPIMKKNILESNNFKSVQILEDFPPSPIGSLLLNFVNLNSKIIIFYKSFFAYHGYSLLRFLANELGGKRIKRIFKTKILTLFSIDDKYIFIYGKRDYNQGRLLALSKKRIIQDSDVNIRKIGTNILFDINENVIYKTNYTKEKLERNKSIFQQINSFKRIGLYDLFYKSIVEDEVNLNRNKITKLEEAYNDYSQSKDLYN